ncbi:MAG: hypothetical protein WC412_01065 [Candidatus Omnitrophota bacterium]
MAQSDKRRYVDRRQYLIAAVYKRRKKVKAMAVEYKGGKCEKCGYSRCIDALEFHHCNSNEKDFSISKKGYTRSWQKVKEEIDKCMLVCANCHREIHVQLQSAASDGNVRVQTEPCEVVPSKAREKLGELREA